MAAHSDSPCLKIKPRSKREKEGFLQVAIETYGGGLWHTWFDRDLGLAGRVSLQSSDGALHERLININRPILRIPTLAIHLDHSVRDGFKFNAEQHLTPILASCLSRKESDEGGHMHSVLSNLIKGEIKMEQEFEIVATDLCLYDVQKASIGGVYSEFVQSARLDNLYSSFAAIQALVGCLSSLEKDRTIRMICLFDNEEVGSLSACGAESTIVSSAIERILQELGLNV